MTRTLFRLLVVSLLFSGPSIAMEPPHHAIFRPESLHWIDATPGIPPGAKVALLEGDPDKEGLFTMRLRLPPGWKIMPHWHTAVEHVTVISGILHIGFGDKFDPSKADALAAGSFVRYLPKTVHYAWVEGDTVIQTHGVGPWLVIYVNPADDPRNSVPAGAEK